MLAIHEVDLTVALVPPCMLLVVMEMRCLYTCMVQFVDALSSSVSSSHTCSSIQWSATAFPYIDSTGFIPPPVMYLGSQVTGPCIAHSAEKASFRDRILEDTLDLLLHPDIPRYKRSISVLCTTMELYVLCTA